VQGLETCLSHPSIDLVITDVIMSGGVSGTEMAAQVRKLYPQIKLLFISGYSDEALLHHGVFDFGVAFLQKPFKMADLVQQLRKILDGGFPKPPAGNSSCVPGIQ
jgi:YesN/AraC family two-component response regulator